MEFLSRPRRVEYARKAVVDNLEVYSSLRLSVSAIISAQQLEQVAIFSGSESDCFVTLESAGHKDQKKIVSPPTLGHLCRIIARD